MTPRFRRGAVTAALTLATLTALTACSAPGPSSSTSPTAAPPASAPTGDDAAPSPSAVPLGPVIPTGEPQAVAGGFAAPWSIAFVGDHALISERDSARIFELDTAGSVREVGVVPGVTPRGEGGLLGLAVDDRQRLYVYSTAQDGNRIERYELTGAPGSYALGPSVTVIDGLPAAGNHNGGRIALGPDGMLSAGVGDAGEPASAQDPGSLAGKILRLTPDGGIPPDNPDPASPVYSSGHRNVQGLAWAGDGTMFASEFGQNDWDELNIIVPGGDYGWPDVEGVVGVEGFVDPVQQWTTDAASPSGIAVAGGTVFIANLRGEILRTVPVADPTTSTDFYAGEFGRLRDVVSAPDGSMWFVTNNTDGRGDPREGDDRILRVEVAEG